MIIRGCMRGGDGWGRGRGRGEEVGVGWIGSARMVVLVWEWI